MLHNHIASQKILSTTTISISTSSASPLFGGGADNIAFLVGDAAALTNPNPAGPNAQTLKVQATFWIETVEHTIVVPPVGPGHQPQIVEPETHVPGLPIPGSWLIRPSRSLRRAQLSSRPPKFSIRRKFS